MADDTTKTINEGEDLRAESTTTNPETENTAADEQAEAEHGNLSEAGGR